MSCYLKETKPCPFCGSNPFYFTDTVAHITMGELTTHTLRCSNIDCPCSMKTAKGKEALIKMWNRRTE